MSEEIPLVQPTTISSGPKFGLKSIAEVKAAASEGILKTLDRCSTPLAIVLITIGIVFLISTIASGIQANSNDNKNEDQRNSIRGFAAASGIFAVLCIIGGGAMIGIKYLKK